MRRFTPLALAVLLIVAVGIALVPMRPAGPLRVQQATAGESRQRGMSELRLEDNPDKAASPGAVAGSLAEPGSTQPLPGSPEADSSGGLKPPALNAAEDTTAQAPRFLHPTYLLEGLVAGEPTISLQTVADPGVGNTSLVSLQTFTAVWCPVPEPAQYPGQAALAIYQRRAGEECFAAINRGRRNALVHDQPAPF